MSESDFSPAQLEGLTLRQVLERGYDLERLGCGLYLAEVPEGYDGHFVGVGTLKLLGKVHEAGEAGYKSNEEDLIQSTIFNGLLVEIKGRYFVNMTGCEQITLVGAFILYPVGVPRENPYAVFWR